MEDTLKPEDLFLARVQEEAIDLQYGIVSVSIVVRNGKPDLRTINIHRTKRIKLPYSLDKGMGK